MKNVLKRGLLAGLIAGIISVVYQMIYSANMAVDFSAVAKPVMIVVSTIIGTVIAGLGYWLLKRLNWFGTKLELVFNSLFFVISFISIFGTFGAPLPEGTNQPELFPGLVIPMHFFPIIFWFLVKPLFDINKEQV